MTVKEAEVEYSVLEGEEEDTFLKKCIEDMKAHMVVGTVIRDYDLDFTVRGNELRIFLDDD